MGMVNHRNIWINVRKYTNETEENKTQRCGLQYFFPAYKKVRARLCGVLLIKLAYLSIFQGQSYMWYPKYGYKQMNG